MTSCSLKILIVGGQGQLACALQAHPRASLFNLVAAPHALADLTNPHSLHDAIANHQPDVVINTAAYTAVDKAETEKELALNVNHLGSKNLAILCEQLKRPLIHLSTDYIFDGKQRQPYREEDEVNPINWYGESKWLGEQAIRQYCERHFILRVSGVFSEYGSNFFKTLLRLAKEKDPIRVVNDQITCPTYAGDIANVLFTLAEQEGAWGTYHYCSQEAASWYEFACAVIAQAAKWQPLQTTRIQAITTKEYPTAAKRPPHSVLDCDKLYQQFNLIQPSWSHSLTQERMYR